MDLTRTRLLIVYSALSITLFGCGEANAPSFSVPPLDDSLRFPSTKSLDAMDGVLSQVASKDCLSFGDGATSSFTIEIACSNCVVIDEDLAFDGDIDTAAEIQLGVVANQKSRFTFRVDGPEGIYFDSLPMYSGSGALNPGVFVTRPINMTNFEQRTSLYRDGNLLRSVGAAVDEEFLNGTSDGTRGYSGISPRGEAFNGVSYTYGESLRSAAESLYVHELCADGGL